MKAPLKCYLRVLSPLHVGCDEVLEPFAFRVDETANQLVCLDPFEFIKGLTPSEKQQFSRLCKKGTIASILEIYKFMRNRPSPGASIDLCSGFVEHYLKVLSLPMHDERKIQQELNSFAIARTARNPNDGRCYIPGSSVKGMLRTAHLNRLASVKNLSTPKGRDAAGELEKRLLDGGSFATDPFRLLKVSDFAPVGAVKTKILYAVNRKKRPSKFTARGPYQMLETVVPDSLFVGWISLQKPERGAGIRNPLDLEKLMASAGSFYARELARENQDLAAIGAGPIQPNAPEPGVPVRLGRHSGAECVTLDKHRSIKIMGAKQQPPRYESNATTLWLAANSNNPTTNRFLLPFGWAVLGAVTEQLAEAIAAAEAQFNKLQDELRAAVVADAVRQPSKSPPQGEVKAAADPVPPRDAQPVREIWQRAALSWNPGSETLTAAWQGKKATARGRNAVPEGLHKALFGKKKAAVADVEVEPLGNSFKIVKVEGPQAS